jgi:hypothetical protein
VYCMCDHINPKMGPYVPVGNDRKMNVVVSTYPLHLSVARFLHRFKHPFKQLSVPSSIHESILPFKRPYATSLIHSSVHVPSLNLPTCGSTGTYIFSLPFVHLYIRWLCSHGNSSVEVNVWMSNPFYRHLSFAIAGASAHTHTHTHTHTHRIINGRYPVIQVGRLEFPQALHFKPKCFVSCPLTPRTGLICSASKLFS